MERRRVLECFGSVHLRDLRALIRLVELPAHSLILCLGLLPEGLRHEGLKLLKLLRLLLKEVLLIKLGVLQHELLLLLQEVLLLLEKMHFLSLLLSERDLILLVYELEQLISGH